MWACVKAQRRRCPVYVARGGRGRSISMRLISLTDDIDLRMCGKGTLTELDQNALYAPVSTWAKSPFQVGGVKTLRNQC